MRLFFVPKNRHCGRLSKNYWADSHQIFTVCRIQPYALNANVILNNIIIFCEENKPKRHIFCTSNLMWKCPEEDISLTWKWYNCSKNSENMAGHWLQYFLAIFVAFTCTWSCFATSKKSRSYLCIETHHVLDKNLNKNILWSSCWNCQPVTYIMPP